MVPFSPTNPPHAPADDAVMSNTAGTITRIGSSRRRMESPSIDSMGIV